MLKERLKFILKDTAIYGIANALSKFLVFLTLPIIVQVLSPADFGIWNLLTMLGSIITAVLIFGIDSAVIRYYFDDSSIQHHRNIFSQGLFLQISLILIFSVIGFLLPQFFLKTININNSYTQILFIVFIWVPANIFSQYFQNWFKWTFQRIRFLIISLGLALTNLIFLFIYSKASHLDLKMILFINAISYWLFVLLGLWWCRKYIQFKLDSPLMKKLMAFGFPMMLVLLISTLSSSLDRFFLVRYLNVEQMGIYSFCQKLSIVMLVAVAAFQTAFGPFAFSIWEKPDAKHTFSRFHSYYIIIAGAIALGICSFSKVLVMLIGNQTYMNSSKYLPILVLGTLVYGLYSFSSLGFFYSKKMLFNLLSLSIGLTINIAVNSMLVPLYKEYGAVIGFLSGNIGLVFSAYFFSRKFYVIEFFYYRDAMKLILLSGMLLSTTISLSDNILAEAFCKTFILIPVFLLSGFFLLTENERNFIRGQLRKYF